MRKHAFLTLAGIGLALTGCGPDMMSLHPLYTERDIVFDEALEGRWLHREDGKTEIWRFSRGGEDFYELRVDDDQKPVHCRLVRISNYLFLDVTDPDQGHTGVSGHMFWRVDLNGDTLRIAAIDGDWLKAKLEKENALAHERVRDGKKTRLVIRASTLDLQAFLLNHAASREAFPEWFELTRDAVGQASWPVLFRPYPR